MIKREPVATTQENLREYWASPQRSFGELLEGLRSDNGGIAKAASEGVALRLVEGDPSSGAQTLAGRLTHFPDWLEGRLDDIDDIVVAALAGNPAASAGFLRAVAAGGPVREKTLGARKYVIEVSDPWRRAVAHNPACPQRLLEELAEHADPLTRQWVAANPSCPAERVTALADDPDSRVRAAVASRADIGDDLIERFTRDPHPGVRRPAARATEEQLRRLADDPDPIVVAGVAAHPSTPAEVLARLRDSADRPVSLAAIANPNTPQAKPKDVAWRRKYAEAHPPGLCRCGRPVAVGVFVEHTRGYDGYTACLWHMSPDYHIRNLTVVAVWTNAGWLATEYGPARSDMPAVYDRPDTVITDFAGVERALQEVIDAQ